MTPEDIDKLEAGPEEECSVCGCAFSAIEFEGIICPNCVAQQEKGAGK